MNFETCSEIEIALSVYFNQLDNVVVPNINGMFNHELDLCVLNYRSLYASEVEIKISRADLKRDLQKRHHHEDWSNRLRNLFFAMPDKLEGSIDLVPEGAGILLVNNKGRVREIRKPKPNTIARKWTYQEAFQLGRLGTMRYWNNRRAEEWGKA